MKKWVVLLLCLLLVVEAAGTVWAQVDERETAAWIAAHAVPFDTAELQGDFSDLLPLLDMIGEARIVALGEATHGTHEFFAMKSRIFRLLVEEAGFTIFAIESPLVPAMVINDYVRGADVDLAAELPTALIPVWQNQEMVDLIEWMRAYNLTQPEPVLSFYGLDAHYGDPAAIDGVLAYLETVEPAAIQWAEAQYACLDYRRSMETLVTVPLRQRQACHQAALAVHDQLLAHQAEYTAATSAEAFEWAVRDAYLVARAAEQATGDGHWLMYLRDETMADNAAWLLARNGPRARMVIWAHNLHVGYFSGRIAEILRDRLELGIVNVGFTFYQGSFWAGTQQGVQTVEAPPARLGSYEHAFHLAGLPRFLLDLRADRADPDAAWLGDMAEFRTIGSEYLSGIPENYYYRLRLADRYDMIIHFEESTAAHSLRWPR